MSENDRQLLIDAAISLAQKLGKTPTRSELRKAIRNFDRRAAVQFKNYLGLLEAAKLQPIRARRTQEDLEKERQEFKIENAITHPEIPDDDIPVSDIIESMCKRFSKRHEAHNAKKWMKFKVNTDLPIGLCWFGDPHIDDDGCNWPLLKRDIEICKTTEGMYGANIGDTHNNWVGRLAKEYANQNTSRGTAWKLIEWFFLESGVNWLLILMGNHDTWNFGTETMSKITKNVCTMIDWRAQFKLEFSNGAECLIDAAHDHSGHSQWNTLHGQQKASSMGGIAHLYIAGHRHTWALAQNECSQTGRVTWLARARGYKHIDHYAEGLGFGSQKFGSSIVTIIDPKADDLNRIKCFADAKEGAEYLTYLRSRK